jgi:hypothetical protein
LSFFDSTNPFERISASRLNLKQRFLGDFSPTYDTGETRVYSAGEMVLYEGKVFTALSTIYGESPDTNSEWFAYGGSRVSYRGTKPPSPQVGDFWLNSSTGKFYVFIDDGETKQFVEL